MPLLSISSSWKTKLRGEIAFTCDEKVMQNNIGKPLKLVHIQEGYFQIGINQLICPFGSKLSQTLLHPFGHHSSYSSRLCVGCEDIDVAVCRNIGADLRNVKNLYLRTEDKGGNSPDSWFLSQIWGNFLAESLDSGNRVFCIIVWISLGSNFGGSYMLWKGILG